ncbi:MAG: glycerophosphodiester phosphodiesterase family protein [Planktomarina sp.]
MTKLPHAFLTRPLAHRALHDKARGRAENSPAAIKAAIDAGYGIEIDVQLSSDNTAMVFHDYHLGRLTGDTGPVAVRSAANLGQVVLSGGTDTIPTLRQVLDQIAGQVPLVIEIKDQDGVMGNNTGPLERAVAETITGYQGDLAIMSFNPNAIATIAPLVPGIALGLVTDRYLAADWPILPAATRDHLAQIADFDRVGSSFISHNQAQLDDAPVAALRTRSVPILCWTVKSEADEVQARKVADNITFEGYLA